MYGTIVVMDRFWSKVDKTDTCWLWTGGKTRTGYGQLFYEGKVRGAHRVSYELANGPIAIDDRRYVMHSCDVPSCVNPDHLKLGSAKENSADRDAKGRARPRGRKSLLTVADVAEIRSQRGKETTTALARRFGVHQTTISDIQLYKSHKGVV